MRVQITDATSLKTGAFLEGIATFAALGEKYKDDVVASVGGPKGLAAVTRALAQFDQNERANEFIRSWTAIQSTFIQAVFFDALQRQRPELAHLSGPPLTRLHLPNGETVDMPIKQARDFHTTILILARRAMLEDGKWAKLASGYRIAVAGECPIDDGQVSVDQRDFAFEMRRDDRVIIVGAVGNSRISGIVNEARFASLVVTAENKAQIDAPDRPAQLLTGAVSTDSFTLTSQIKGGCVLTLEREP